MRTNLDKVTSKRGIFFCPVETVRVVGDNIFVLRFRSPEIAHATLPGQFVNIRVVAGYLPLLRRPFSVYHTDGEFVEIIFNAVGRGTQILSRKKAGDTLDVMGPLGHPYGFDDGFITALLVAGGLGVAPLPMITKFVADAQKRVVTFLGTRTRNQIVTDYLKNVSLATDDGSEGFSGTVVELLASRLAAGKFDRPKIFACGPNIMLKRLAELAASYGIACEVSLECAMACGFGICQGCPVELTDGYEGGVDNRKKYALVCKEGPVFDAREVCIEG